MNRKSNESGAWVMGFITGVIAMLIVQAFFSQHIAPVISWLFGSEEPVYVEAPEVDVPNEAVSSHSALTRTWVGSLDSSWELQNPWGDFNFGGHRLSSQYNPRTQTYSVYVWQRTLLGNLDSNEAAVFHDAASGQCFSFYAGRVAYNVACP